MRVCRQFLRRHQRALAHPSPRAVFLACTAVYLLLGWPGVHGDLRVYRMAVRTWLSGGDLYGPLPHTQLLFTYPPVAALATTPLGLMGATVAFVVLTLLGLAGLLGCLQRLGWSPWWACVVLVSEPVRSTIGFGQLNLVLVALALSDCLAPRRTQGWRVGLAAAIKLTPAIFILYFLMKRRYQAAGAAAVTFFSVNAAAAVIMPETVLRYWRDCFPGTDRIGSAWYAGNESWWAIITRARAPHPGLLWVGMALLTLALLAAAVKRVDEESAVILTGLAGLLVSPISWSHHWIWGVLAVYVLAQRHRVAGALAFLPFLVAPQWWFPNHGDRELTWTAPTQLLAAAYVGVGFLLLLLAGCRPGGAPFPQDGAEDARQARLDVHDGGGQPRIASVERM